MTQRESLLHLLAAHHPADTAEHDHLRRMIDLARSDPDPFSRRRFHPGHFTASAFILDPRRNTLLLVHHAKLGRWLQPGGHIDPADADLIAAARREAREETGLDRLTLDPPDIFDLDIHRIPPLGDEPAHEHFDVRFLFHTPAPGSAPGSASGSASAPDPIEPGGDARDARWFPLDRIDAHTSDASILRAIRKLPPPPEVPPPPAPGSAPP